MENSKILKLQIALAIVSAICLICMGVAIGAFGYPETGAETVLENVGDITFVSGSSSHSYHNVEKCVIKDGYAIVYYEGGDTYIVSISNADGGNNN